MRREPLSATGPRQTGANALSDISALLGVFLDGDRIRRGVVGRCLVAVRFRAHEAENPVNRLRQRGVSDRLVLVDVCDEAEGAGRVLREDAQAVTPGDGHTEIAREGQCLNRGPVLDLHEQVGRGDVPLLDAREDHEVQGAVVRHFLGRVARRPKRVEVVQPLGQLARAVVEGVRGGDGGGQNDYSVQKNANGVEQKPKGQREYTLFLKLCKPLRRARIQTL